MVEMYTLAEAWEAEDALWRGDWDHPLLERLGPLWPMTEENIKMVWENCGAE